MENNGTTQFPNASEATSNAGYAISSIAMDSTTLEIAGNTSVQQYLNSTAFVTTVKAPSIEDFIEYHIGVALWKYMTLVVIILGLIGNILSFLVMKFTSMNKAASSIYLAALAIFDTGVLLVGLGRQWSRNMFTYDIRAAHEWACKIHVFFTYMFIDLSAWMLVCVTIDRVILVYLPLRAKSICTKRKTMTVICLITFFIVGVNFHWFFTVGQRNFIRLIEEIQFNCAYLEGFEEFHRTFWPWIDASVASFIPFITLFVCNILIVTQLVKAAARRKNQMNVTSSKQDDTTRSMTIMLVMISFLFLCFTSPVVLLDVVIQPDITRAPTTAEKASEKLTVAIVNLLMYLNSALNFVMYCLSGKKFRDSLRELFCKKKTAYRRQTNTQSSLVSQSETNFKTKVSRIQGSKIDVNTVSGSLDGIEGREDPTENRQKFTKI
ncbi:unnamed protein product [Owenia fusiformis]|uniref:Uncharacterized protein n=1 Tax=Owenia fusiformis TaxID=6347 RepID=A0A8J1TBK4_OWEFU|nr:unnamed protein product [Owenia fusiformis]